MSQSTPPDAIAVTPVYRTGVQEPTREVSMIDVTVSAFHLTGFIMAGALLAGLLVGATYVWFRKGRAVTTIEARGNNHNFLRE